MFLSTRLPVEVLNECATHEKIELKRDIAEVDDGHGCYPLQRDHRIR